MKLGMIFECTDRGADIDVCVHLAKRIRPDITVDTDALGNKRRLLCECGSSAAQLLQDGCEKVFIIWDLYPSFKRKEAPCRHRDRTLIRESLAAAGVSDASVSLICIEAELESWLVADYRAVREVLRRWNPSAKTGRMKQALRTTDPKAVLARLFEQQIGAPYQPHIHAKQIAQKLRLVDLRKVESFRRFESKLKS